MSDKNSNDPDSPSSENETPKDQSDLNNKLYLPLAQSQDPMRYQQVIKMLYHQHTLAASPRKVYHLQIEVDHDWLWPMTTALGIIYI